MPSIDRALKGAVLVLDLDAETRHADDAAILGRSGRNARTLIKDGPLRVTLVVLAPGGRIPEHEADGPITIQPLRGTVRFLVGDAVHEAGPGQLLSAGPHVRHSVETPTGAEFLLTVALVAGAAAGTDAGTDAGDVPPAD
jgi:quercetin dioxygenase-like cupin family protein